MSVFCGSGVRTVLTGPAMSAKVNFLRPPSPTIMTSSSSEGGTADGEKLNFTSLRVLGPTASSESDVTIAGVLAVECPNDGDMVLPSAASLARLGCFLGVPKMLGNLDPGPVRDGSL